VIATHGRERGHERQGTLTWILLSALGLAIGLAVGLGLAPSIQTIVGMMLVTPVALVLSGSLLGASQSVALHRLDRSGALWIAATALGVALGMTLGIVIVETVARALTGETVRVVALAPATRFFGLAAVGTVTGVVVGLAQLLALQKYAAVGRRWVYSSALGFGAGLPIGGLAADLLVGGLRSAAGFGLFLAVAGLLMGLLTARGARRIAAAAGAAADIG
jgi:hypothetical protein